MVDVRQRTKQAVKTAAAAYDTVRPPDTGVVVLGYHRVGARSTLELDLPTPIFAEQMAYLASDGRTLSLEESIASLEGVDGPPRVAITFDDGTADFMDEALPAIVENGLPVTYYVASKFIEEQRSFPEDGRPLSWSALVEAVSTGLISVGSHTHSHAVADKLTPEQFDDELRRCSELIEDRLGVAADDFAYPKGVFGGTANERNVARRHRSAALANCGINAYGATDPLRLDRTPIQRSDGMRYFYKKVAGGMRFEGTLRSVLNRRRYGSSVS